MASQVGPHALVALDVIVHFKNFMSIFMGSSKNIFHPWHMIAYFSMSPNIPSHVSNNILSMLTRCSWKDSLELTCSRSHAHCSCSHAHKITSLSYWPSFQWTFQLINAFLWNVRKCICLFNLVGKCLGNLPLVILSTLSSPINPFISHFTINIWGQWCLNLHLGH
jgi:hypothetical protein